MADAPLMALTVRPPWSVAIARAWKLTENRGWATRYRGLLAIHSGTTVATEAYAFPPLAALWTTATAMPCGAVIAVATLEDCHQAAACRERCGPGMCSEWAMPGYAYHWALRGVQALPEPVPCDGKQRLWRLPDDVEEAVRAQLEEAGDGKA